MNCAIAISITPMDTLDDREVCRIVDRVIDYIDASGISYTVGSFESVIEGDFEQCMEVLKGCITTAEEVGCTRITCNAKVTYRPGGQIMTTEEKLRGKKTG